jgi:hypothetical protein
MSDDEQTPLGYGPRPRKPRSKLRHWSTYATTGEFYDDYAGYVPLAMMAGITRLQKAMRMSFADAYRTLYEAGAIIHLDEPRMERRRPKRAPSDAPPARGRRGSRGSR